VKLELLADLLAVCRLDAQEPIPAWALAEAAGGLWSLTRSADELSIVCAQALAPAGVRREDGWRAFKVAGPLDFALVGILADLSGLLARAQVSLFAISTYDTDYILVKSASLPAAVAAFREGGHHVALGSSAQV
jgi:hypothetical protein